MNIYPQDLGQGLCTKILQWRGMMKGLGPDALGKGTRHGASLAGTLGATLGFSFGVMCDNLPYLHDVPFLVCGGIGSLLGYGCGYIMHRRNLSKLHVNKITEQEITFISKSGMGNLEKDYLGVVSALMALPSPPAMSEEQSIRDAVRSLGVAIEKLPMQPAEGAFVEPAQLKVEAADLTAKAENEADPVVAASLSRQADAMRRRAETTARTAALARRNHILRQEIAGQVNAFQTSIAAASMNGSQEVADFEALAVSVAQVAQEADALADARAELDTALGQTRTTAEPVTLTTQIARR